MLTKSIIAKYIAMADGLESIISVIVSVGTLMGEATM